MANVVISMLRAVNVGGHNTIPMAELRDLYESLRFGGVQTYVQSGNVIFSSRESDLDILERDIANAIERRFGSRIDVILRTASEMREVIRKNPFAARQGIEPNKLLVTFLARDPGREARDCVLAMKTEPDEIRFETRELYTYFPHGMGKSKLPVATIARLLKVPGTGRNWNSVTKMLEIAAKLEA
jgi:uncharacterized protein (DUF1697 family)